MLLKGALLAASFLSRKCPCRRERQWRSWTSRRPPWFPAWWTAIPIPTSPARARPLRRWIRTGTTSTCSMRQRALARPWRVASPPCGITVAGIRLSLPSRTAYGVAWCPGRAYWPPDVPSPSPAATCGCWGPRPTAKPECAWRCGSLFRKERTGSRPLPAEAVP